MPARSLEKTLFVLILTSYVIAGALYAIYTPPWQAPDEPAHFNYIRQIAEAGCCPRIEIGDWQSDYLSQLTTSRFAPEHLDQLDNIQYEDHHPPLYYLLASVVYKLTNGDLIALRLFSVVLGAAVVCLSFLISCSIVPDQPQIALGVMALVAFSPQHLSMMASVNNDALAELVVALALLWLIRRNPDDLAIWQLGMIVGVALLTKITIYFLALIAPLTIWLKWRRQGRPARDFLRSIAIFLLVAVLIGGIWWLRNIAVYGFPDFLGLAAHDAVVADQPRTADYIAQHGFAVYLSQLTRTTFSSFWGQFGWMALPLDSVLGGWIYRSFAVFTLAGLAGAILAARRWFTADRDSACPHISADAIIVLLATMLLVALQFIYYNIEFQQWQGRYLYPALIPVAFLLVCGLDHWRARLLSQWDTLRWLTPLGMICLCALDIYLLFWVIVPGLSA